MSIDLSAAVRAGIEAGAGLNPRLCSAASYPGEVSQRAVLAAAPLIEAAVREQVAREVEAHDLPIYADEAEYGGLERAARIARGEQP